MDNRTIRLRAKSIRMLMEIQSLVALSLELLAGFALLALITYEIKLRWTIDRLPRLNPVKPAGLPSQLGTAVNPTKLSVIVPAYNEAANVEACLISILDNTADSEARLEVWLVDDQSTDATLAIAQTLQQNRADPRLKVLAGLPRPVGEAWVGKNWACEQAIGQATGDFLLFLDADVRLSQGAIAAALEVMQQDAVDLLSCGPAIECGCFAEWLVQPLMISILLVGFNVSAINDPVSETAFAAGPFMLFRRTAYDKVGGHRAVAGEVVEDVELARRVKSQGLRLRFLSGSRLITVRMYRSGSALWEGWTKNLYIGSRRNLRGMLTLIGLMLLLAATPWLVLTVTIARLLLGLKSPMEWVTIAVCLVSIALQYDLRRVGETETHISPRYWWLSAVGGAIVAAMAIVSIIKTETGWGWTWRGRSLKQD